MRPQLLSISTIATALMCLLPLSTFAQWQVTNTLHPGGEGGWDYVTVDAPGHRLFVTRGTHTQAIDTRSGKLLADIPGQVRSHGVAVIPITGALTRGMYWGSTSCSEIRSLAEQA